MQRSSQCILQSQSTGPSDMRNILVLSEKTEKIKLSLIFFGLAFRRAS